MSLLVFPPCPALAPYVRLLAVDEATAGGPYRVLPGTGLVMGFQYQGALAYYADGQRHGLAAAGITGICARARLFESAPRTGTVLVGFREAGAAPFLRLPAHELYAQSVALDALWPRPALAALTEALAAAPAAAHRARLVEAFLLAQLRPAAPDKLVGAALAVLHATRGQVRVAALARELGVSTSPLEKRFRQAVGASPKKIATLLRLQHAVARYRPGLSLTELSYAAGFYDQAHFIHAFREYSGQAPGEYFRGLPP